MSMYKSEGFGLRLGLGLARRSGVRVSSSRQRALIQSPGKRCITRKKVYYHPITGSLTFYLERYHAPFDWREGEGSEKKRWRERRQRGREICRLFVNADKYKCLAIFNMAMVRTTL